MPETNGSHWEARLTRIEQAGEEFRRDMRNLLTAQVLQKDQIDNLVKAIELEREQRKAGEQRAREERKVLDERVDKLVSAIGDLIRRMPGPALGGTEGR